jgi:hypothetical protein
VRRRLAVQPEPARPSWWQGITAWWAGLSTRRAVATAALALVLIGAVLVALIPSARETVAGWLGVRGIHIVFVDETPTPAPTPTAPPATPGATPTPASLGSALLLGERTTLEEAQAMVDFPILVPTSIGAPDEVYVRQRPDGPMISLLYYPRPGLPATEESGVGLLLVEFEAAEDSFWDIKKIDEANRVEPARVNNRDGLWLEGTHLLMIAFDPVGRAAGNVLLWDENGVTYRLEADLSKLEAIALAEELAPAAVGTPVAGSATP